MEMNWEKMQYEYIASTLVIQYLGSEDPVYIS